MNFCILFFRNYRILEPNFSMLKGWHMIIHRKGKMIDSIVIPLSNPSKLVTKVATFKFLWLLVMENISDNAKKKSAIFKRRRTKMVTTNKFARQTRNGRVTELFSPYKDTRGYYTNKGQLLSADSNFVVDKREWNSPALKFQTTVLRRKGRSWQSKQ